MHCHAWGDGVVTAAAAGYTKGFGGTSAASAIVAGVAVPILQGMHKAAHGVPLGATALRALLADPAAGHRTLHRRTAACACFATFVSASATTR